MTVIGLNQDSHIDVEPQAQIPRRRHQHPAAEPSSDDDQQPKCSDDDQQPKCSDDDQQPKGRGSDTQWSGACNWSSGHSTAPAASTKTDMSACSRMSRAIPTGINILNDRMEPPAEFTPFSQRAWAARGLGNEATRFSPPSKCVNCCRTRCASTP